MQASSSVILGRVVLAQEQDYRPLIAGVVFVSILLLLMLALFAWIKRKKHIDGAYCIRAVSPRACLRHGRSRGTLVVSGLEEKLMFNGERFYL